ncbi:uncharacterized protein CTRU02_212294 [Colletotrichum truncatum]|uniref:Uncharacterized protein n=1 Tax=Colletotrichum truncatum TaxID=5467 RepID=A0ACC3YN53_COLTU|nr:uncharacterized protein CTRU02_08826 [Colletotrichum truncatum]KAF6789579.1 hypothetical protein CTRU02_08826 [Colletotrichum truncatum]
MNMADHHRGRPVLVSDPSRSSSAISLPRYRSSETTQRAEYHLETGSDPSVNLMPKPTPEVTTTATSSVAARNARRPTSASAIYQLCLDILLTIPSICFLIYAFMVYSNNGKSIDQDPVPDLETAAKYSPTIFPIAFAAVIANLLKATAAWKLERGISVLSLEYLLSSRTVFSTLTAPFILRTVNLLTPFLIVLWALSPLGGQAGLRVMDVVPSQATESWPYQYLEVMSPLSHQGSFSQSGMKALPPILSAFVGTLSSPKAIKASPRDLFGNIKIPLVEAYQMTGKEPDLEGWFKVNQTSGSNSTVWSSVAGVPATCLGGLSEGANFTYTMETSYMYTNCSVGQVATENPYTLFEDYLKNNTGGYDNGHSLVIRPTKKSRTDMNIATPAEWTFTSYTAFGITNATCKLTTTHVELDIACRGATCSAVRARPLQKAKNMTVLTVLDNIRPSNVPAANPKLRAGVVNAFLSTFIKGLNTPWDEEGNWQMQPYSSPIEYFFTHPDTPFSATIDPNRETEVLPGWRGEEIYPIGDVLFSERFSQLLNTFWLSSIAPENITGNFNFGAPDYTLAYETALNFIRQNVTGTRTPDVLVMQVNKSWLAVLFIASVVMLASGIAASVLNLFRRGPDILDHPTGLLRDNPHVHMVQSTSMEDATEQIRRNGGVRVCLGDIKSHEDTGYLVVGCSGDVAPLGLQRKERRFE